MPRKSPRKPQMDLGGMDEDALKALVANIPPNPVTGRVDLPDIMKYMSQNPAQMESLMAMTSSASAGRQDADLSSYDFASLAKTIRPRTIWVIQMENWGLVDAAGNPVDESRASSVPGARPTFMIYCYDDKGRHRAMQECTGLPKTEVVLQALRCAIAKPILPLLPGLPGSLLVSRKFQAHIPGLRPFLDSLPKPFSWRLETAAEADEVGEGVHDMNERGVRAGLAHAEKEKTAGNAAFVRRDRRAAVAAYDGAIDALLDVLAQKPDDDDLRTAKKTLAVCHANRAAALLLEGEGMDAEGALRDGKIAEEEDADYGKGYYRQAKALQALGRLSDAQDALARGLRRPAIENDNGLSDDEQTFKDWMLDILMNDAASSQRMNGIKGEWARRCDVKLARWKEQRDRKRA